MKTSNNSKNEIAISNELINSLLMLKRAKTEYEKTDIEIELSSWDIVNNQFQKLFSEHNHEYNIMKHFLDHVENEQLDEFFDLISPHKNIHYLKKFLLYKELDNNLPKEETEDRNKSKI